MKVKRALARWPFLLLALIGMLLIFSPGILGFRYSPLPLLASSIRSLSRLRERHPRPRWPLIWK